MKIVTLIQTRMGSGRLPGKVLKPLGGKTVIEIMYERIKRSRLAGEVAIVTTIDLSDDIVYDLCKQQDMPCYRGSINDLLDRHYRIAKQLRADAVIKIPSDCPLIDHRIIDQVIRFYLDHAELYDFVSNLHPPTWPDGNDVEIMSMKTLEEAWLKATAEHEREHTTPFIWDNPDLYRVGNVVIPGNKDYSKTHRWVLDYEQDYEFLKIVYNHLYPIIPDFSCKDIIDLLEEIPQIRAINREHLGVSWYQGQRHNLKTIYKIKQKLLRKAFEVQT